MKMRRIDIYFRDHLEDIEKMVMERDCPRGVKCSPKISCEECWNIQEEVDDDGHESTDGVEHTQQA
jgi:hypothetical protein